MADNKHKKYGTQKNSAQNKVYKGVNKRAINKAKRMARMFNNGINLAQVRSVCAKMGTESPASLKEGVRLYNKEVGASINWVDLTKKMDE